MVKFVEVTGTRVPLVKRSDIPPTVPEQLNGTAARMVVFPSEFNCYALDLLVDNRDAANPLTFRLNGSGDIKTIDPGGFIAYSDQIIIMLEILAGSTSWEVSFSKVPLGVRETGQVYGEAEGPY